MAVSHLLCVDNLYNVRQNSARVVSASSRVAGYDEWRVGRASRSPANQWRANGSSNEYVAADAGAATACDFIALDRGHNLGGVAIKLQGSSASDFSGATDVLSLTVPSSLTVGRSIDNAAGAYTREGAWIKRFTEATFRYWRLFVASGTPRVVGLYLGKAWSPSSPFTLPYEPLVYDVGGNTVESDFGWASTTTPWRRRMGNVAIRLRSDELTASQAFYDQITRRHPFWLVHNTANAEDAVLAYLPPQQARYGQEPGWFPREMRFAWQEWEAAAI